MDKISKIEVSIIIPSFNSDASLAKTIEVSLAQDYPKDKFEIIVVDDGSKDNTERTVKAFPVRYMYQERRGPAAARNYGWRSAKGRLMCFIDADCIPYKNWISKLVEHSFEDDVGAVAGSYAVGASRYLLDKFVHYEIKYRHENLSRYTNSFGTYNVLVKKTVLEKLGGFDERYRHASGEDSDLAYRIIKAGYKIYFEKDALVSHLNILRFYKYSFIQFRHSFWRMKLYKDNASMIVKDEYGYWKDFVEIFLVASLMISLVWGFQVKFWITKILVLTLFVIQIPLCVKISLEQKDIRYLFFPFVTFIRIFIRLLGGILGFISFWIIRRKLK